MKVLQINNVYGKGSTGKITYDISSYLKESGIGSYVIYGRGQRVKEEGVYKVADEYLSKARNVTSRVFGMPYGRAVLPTVKTIRLIRKLKPDVVHLQCLNGFFINIYKLIGFLKEQGIPTVLTLHAEFMHTGNCGHAFDCTGWLTGCTDCGERSRYGGILGKGTTARAWQRMKAAFDGFDNLIVASVSEWLSERARQSPILADKRHRVVHNGLDTSVFRVYRREETEDSIAEFGKSPVVFHATPDFNDPIKGGVFVTELAKRMPDVKFLVAGRYDGSLEYPPNIVFLGNITDGGILARYYNAAKLTLLTSKRETFSMIVAESLSCGTPVAGFKAGAPETIALTEYSEFADYGDIDALRGIVERFLNFEWDREEISRSAHGKYAGEVMAEKYLGLYREISGSVTE